MMRHSVFVTFVPFPVLVHIFLYFSKNEGVKLVFLYFSKKEGVKIVILYLSQKEGVEMVSFMLQ